MAERREERRLIACLFIDVVGSTELTVRLDDPLRALRAADSARGWARSIRHEALRAIGYVGWSELLAARTSIPPA